MAFRVTGVECVPTIFEARITGPIARRQARIVLADALEIAIRTCGVGTTNQDGHSDEDGRNKLHVES